MDLQGNLTNLYWISSAKYRTDKGFPVILGRFSIKAKTSTRISSKFDAKNFQKSTKNHFWTGYPVVFCGNQKEYQ